MSAECPDADVEDGTVTCPICGRVGGVGLPRHAVVKSVGDNPTPSIDETDGRDRQRTKCRPQRCRCGHTFEICFVC